MCAYGQNTLIVSLTETSNLQGHAQCIFTVNDAFKHELLKLRIYMFSTKFDQNVHMFLLHAFTSQTSVKTQHHLHFASCQSFKVIFRIPMTSFLETGQINTLIFYSIDRSLNTKHIQQPLIRALKGPKNVPILYSKCSNYRTEFVRI